jgi:hypothetical protein
MSYGCSDFATDLETVAERANLPPVNEQWCMDMAQDPDGLAAVAQRIDDAIADRAALIDAAREVIARWQSGDLAEAVRNLAAVVDDATRTVQEDPS